MGNRGIGGPHFPPLLNVADTPLTVGGTEDISSRFCGDYRKVAEEFNKRYDKDLNTTLIFVSFPSRSGGTY